MASNTLLGDVPGEGEVHTDSTGIEVQVDMDGLDIGDLIAHLTSRSQQTLALLYHGLPCKHVPQDSTSARDVDHSCLPTCLNMAHVAFEIQKKARTGKMLVDVYPSASKTVKFLEGLFDRNTLEESFKPAVHSETNRGSSSLEALIEQEPFKEAFDKVILLHLRVSREGFLRCFQLMWDNAPHVPVVASILTHKEETLLCLRVRASPSYSIYIILDCHVRPGSCHRGPTFSIHKSREGAADYLHTMWDGNVDEEDEEEATPQEFSVHIILQNQQSLPPDPSDQDDVPVIPSSKSPSPLSCPKIRVKPIPLPPAAIEEPASPKPKPEAVKPRKSHARLHSEFGWQMGLQDAPPLPSPTVPPSPPQAESVKEVKVEDQSEGPPSSPRRSPKETRVEPPSMNRRPRGDLSKKDIGWQLALQEQIGGLTMPLQTPTDDASEKTGHKSQKSLGQTSSATSLSLKSGGSSPMLPRTPLASSSQAEIERQKPVRADIGWQHNLEAKSMTFPIQNLKAAGADRSNGSTPALGGPASTIGGAGALNPSHIDGTTEFGEFKTTPKPEAIPVGITASGESEFEARDSITAECDYCFGLILVDDLMSEFGTVQCDHRICRDCLRRYILQELAFCNFPIRCPACMLRNRIHPTHANMELLDKLDFSDVEKDKFIQLEFQTLPVVTKCPKCAHPSQSSREELLENKWMSCTRCRGRWCRDCHRIFPKGSTPESADAEHALHVCKDRKRDALPNRKHGRFCPGCQTFTHRPLNSNNAECASGKCGLHFCFKCGGVIADTAKGQNPDRLAILHSQTCPEYANTNAGDDKCTIQ